MTTDVRLRALPGSRVGVSRRGAAGLQASPVRPGEMPARVLVYVKLAPVYAGVPVGLQVVVAIEAAHALERVCFCGLTSVDLDAAAEPREPRGLIPPPRLLEYASQLRRAGEPDAGPVAAELELLPPSRLLGAWRLAAHDQGVTLERWMTEMLARAPAGALRWEAAAASEGLTLSEWVLLQALSA
jgi:hypothetical protein